MYIPIHHTLQQTISYRNEESWSYRSLSVTGDDWQQQRPINDVWMFRTHVSPLGIHGQSFFLIVKEQQGQMLLHDWWEQGSRNSPTVPEQGEQVWNGKQGHPRVQSSSSKSTVMRQVWGQARKSRQWIRVRARETREPSQMRLQHS